VGKKKKKQNLERGGVSTTLLQEESRGDLEEEKIREGGGRLPKEKSKKNPEARR